MKTAGGWFRGAWRGQPWPVGPVTLVTHKDEAVLRRLSEQWLESNAHVTSSRPLPQARQLAEFRAGLKLIGGVFVVTDSQKQVCRDLADPNYGDDLVRVALTFNLNDTAALTALVSSHGPLHSGSLLEKIWFKAFGLLPPSRIDLEKLRVRDDWEAVSNTPLRGSLFGTSSVLSRFRWFVEWLVRLQNTRAGEREWAKFVASLEPDLRNMHPTVRWDREAGAQPCWTLNFPQDVLSATIWNWATRGADLRRCRRCQLLFPADNPKQQFCTRTCANRASAARWYRIKGRTLRRAARDRRGSGGKRR